MRYKNKYTGIIVKPSCALAAQTFIQSPIWEEVQECSKSEQTPISAENLQMNTSPVDIEAQSKIGRLALMNQQTLMMIAGKELVDAFESGA